MGRKPKRLVIEDSRPVDTGYCNWSRLGDWRSEIDRLITEYGENTFLSFEAEGDLSGGDVTFKVSYTRPETDKEYDKRQKERKILIVKNKIQKIEYEIESLNNTLKFTSDEPVWQELTRIQQVKERSIDDLKEQLVELKLKKVADK